MSSPSILVATSPELRQRTGLLSIGVVARPKKNAPAERPKDVSELSKVAASLTSAPLRRRKALPKPEKPKWRNIVRIGLKNLLLLALLLSLGRTALKWTERIGESAVSPFAALDYEVRVSDLEASLKSTVKMLEDQLEDVHEKIGTVKGGMVKQVEERGSAFEKELRELGDRMDGLSKSLEELKSMSFLSKEEYESFLDELKNTGVLDGSDKSVRLDEVRALARDIVQREIEKHAADGLGRVDYAVASGGGRVVRHSEPYGSGKTKSWLAAAKSRKGVHPSAQKMLEPSFGEPGQCFPLQGSQGFVEIRLRTGIIPEAITLEHVPQTVAYDRSTAPKHCRIFAWFERPDSDPSNQTDKMILLTEFSYNLEKSNAQTFDVVTSGSNIINIVRLEFSNHGSSSLTCIYRLRVHGYERNTFPATTIHA